MQKKKQKLIDKIVKKDFNDELEKVLENKNFSEETKNILLTILYKIEISYEDMKTVKQDIKEKEEYIQDLIENINSKCDDIKLININSKKSKIKENATFYINKEKKEIECYPIERKLLYSIWKISRKEKIIKDKYYLINETLTDLLNIGNVIQNVEPLRDFNGYSWTTINREIESIEHNFIYQLLEILVGNYFLEEWINQKEYLIDYYEEFTCLIEEKYGIENKEKIINYLEKISILLENKFNGKKISKYQKDKNSVNDELKKMENMAKYLEEISKQKIKSNNRIKKINEILNNKEKLQEEYIEKNKELPLNKKIFSMRILSNILKEEKEKLYKKIGKLNKLINPKNFIKYKQELEEKQKILNNIETKDNEEQIKLNIIQFEKTFLDCFKIKIENAKTKDEIIALFYKYRYYNLLPKNQENIKENEELKKHVILKLIEKATQEKIIVKISKNKEYEYEILKNIFNSRVIKLENLSIKITKEKEKVFLQIFEEKIEIFKENKINLKDLEIKTNKNIKIFLK